MPDSVAKPSLNLVWKLGALAADIKLHHSVFALPWALLSTVLAAHRVGGLKWGQLVLILICMVTGRTVAMAANRLLDAEIDAANPRTARRAVPSGKLTKSYLLVAISVCATIFIAAAAGFFILYKNLWPVALSVPVLLFLVGYSLMKRYTRLCHYYLGAALALAPLCAWLAITGSIALPPVLMAGAVLLWTAGFDILYACQDFAFDMQNGLFSVPAKIGVARALWVARITHLGCVGFMVSVWRFTPELGPFFAVGVCLAAGLLVIEHLLVKADDLSRLTLAFFTLNGVISVMLGGMGIVDILRYRM